MSTTAPPPTTPKQTPSKFALNRSLTLPSRKASITPNRASPATAEIGATEGVETLYVHPNGKIVKFTSNAVATSRPRSSMGPDTGFGQGTLPWATLTEKTMAAGPLEIYRVPGSVSFLHSGSLLHAILPRSNCWCVDGVSKFAMRVLPDTYYRIELPGETAEDLEKVEDFKATLQTVLFYERTVCPFARTFSVPLPIEEDPTPKRRRRRTDGPAKKWKLEKAYSWKPEGWTPHQHGPSHEFSGSAAQSDDESSSSSTESQAEEIIDQVKELAVKTPSRRLTVKERAKGLNLRSVTAPQLSVQSTPQSRLRAAPGNDAVTSHTTMPDAAQSARATTVRTSPDRRCLIPTSMPPSPPDSSAGCDSGSGEQTTRAILPQRDILSQHESDIHNPFTRIPADVSMHVADKGPAVANASAHPDQLNAAPLDRTEREATDSVYSTGAPIPLDEQPSETHVVEEASQRTLGEGRNPVSSLPWSTVHRDPLDQISPTTLSYGDARPENDSPPTSADPIEQPRPTLTPQPTDPFAAIQARIQARRSIGETTGTIAPSLTPRHPPTLTSTASSTSLRSNLSRRSQPSGPRPQDPALASAIVKTFLGPPTSLVAIMLRIAARFAKGVFPHALIFESPAGMPKRVPGSFDLDGSDVEDLDEDDDDAGLSQDEFDGEDDFGVPLRPSPVRLECGGKAYGGVGG